MAAAADEPTSWGDFVRAVDQDRKRLPWDPEKVVPVQRASLYQRKRAERDLDPITMQYRDTTREEQYQSKKTEQIQSKVDRVNAQRTKAFNILSHEGGGPRKVDLLNREKKGERPYHLVSNLQAEDHKQAPVLFDDAYFQAKFRPNEARAKTSLGHQRDFNVVTNEYFQDHEARRGADFEKLKSHLLKKYWDTHDFDAVKGRHFSPEKERQYREQLRVLELAHGQAQQARLPPSAKFADGASYNIISQQCDDEDKFKASQIMANRSLNRMKKLEKEAILKEEGALRASLEERLRMNKVSFQHWQQQLDRGYDFVTNQRVTNPPAPAPARPATMWARLTGGDADYAAANPTAVPQARVSRGSPGPAPTAFAAPVGGADVASTRIRNLSGQGVQLRETSGGGGEVQLVSSSSRAQQGPVLELSAASARQAVVTVRPSKSAMAGAVPALNLSTTDFAQPVAYKEPVAGPPGLGVAIVRTGGLSAYR